MPKSRLRRTLPPVAVLVAVTTIVSLFSPSVFFPNTTVLATPTLVVSNAPNSSYVELAGVAKTNSSITVVLADGKIISSKDLTLKLTLAEKRGNECNVQLAVECDGFYNQLSIDGSIVNGHLIIDSERSVFLINSGVNKQQNILLAQNNGWKLDGTVNSMTAKLSTAIDPYRVTAIMVSSPATRTEKGWPITLHAGYDPTTGILVYSGMSLSDVLLEKLGIDLILGELNLVSYSENLNLEIASMHPAFQFLNSSAALFVIVVSSMIVVLVVVVVCVTRSKRQRGQAGVYNVLELNDNTRKSCEVGD